MKRRLLSLILAGAMAASIAGCKSSDPGAGTDVSTPDVGSVSVSTPEVEPTPAPEVQPAPDPEPETEPTPAPGTDVEPESTPEPNLQTEPDLTPDGEAEPAPDAEEIAGPSLDDLIQLVEQALSQGGLNYDVSAEGDGLVVSVWVNSLGATLSAAAASGFSLESAVQAAGGDALVLLERNLLELVGGAGYEDMPVTLRVLDDRDLDQVLFVLSDGEITVFEN